MQPMCGSELTPKPLGLTPADLRLAALANHSAAGLEAARRKWEEMARSDGPAYVTLTVDELASLIAQGLGPAGRAAVDSIAVCASSDGSMPGSR